MPHIDDYSFRRSCAQYVRAQLGATSDDAAALFGCSECGARFGHLEPTRQLSVAHCHACKEECVPIPVDPIRPGWIKNEARTLEAKKPVSKISDEDIAIGARVHELAAAEMRRRGALRIHRRHVDLAIQEVQSEGTEHSPERLRVLRKRYRDRKYRDRKHNTRARPI